VCVYRYAIVKPWIAHACPRAHVLESANPWFVTFAVTAPVDVLYSTTCHVPPSVRTWFVCTV
jgi:hypothetical protein